jgi:hypothetical protein
MVSLAAVARILVGADMRVSKAVDQRVTQENAGMATVSKRRPTKTLPPLENGDHLDQRTFHARYESMPEDFRAELIGGIVHVPSPQKVPHSRTQILAVRWVDEYAEATPGTDALVNNTQILGPASEPEPDTCLFILPDYGGQVFVDVDGYLNGSPDLIVEVSASTESIDLHTKKRDYESRRTRVCRAGAPQTKGVLVCAAPRQIQGCAAARRWHFPLTSVSGPFARCGGDAAERSPTAADRAPAGAGHARACGFCGEVGEASVQTLTILAARAHLPFPHFAIFQSKSPPGSSP